MKSFSQGRLASSSSCRTTPVLPNTRMKANASGRPAKFALILRMDITVFSVRLPTAVSASAARKEMSSPMAVDSNESPQSRLRALIAAQLQQIGETPALPAILHSRELNVDNAALRDRFRGVLMQYQAHLVANLQAMAEARMMGAGVQPKDAAVLLTSLVQGIAIRWSLGSRSFDIVPEGMRLLEVQLVLFARKEMQT